MRSADQVRVLRSKIRKPAASAGSTIGRPARRSDASSCQPRNHRALSRVPGAVSRHHSSRLVGSMWSGTWPHARIHCSWVRLMIEVAITFGRRESAVRRQGPRARPSARAGKLSRPEAETARAAGGSRRNFGLDVSCRTTLTVALQTSSPSESMNPGVAWREGTASRAWASSAPDSRYAAALTADEPMSIPIRLIAES